MARCGQVIVLCGALIALAGCSSTAEQTSQAFVDPARYALYDCNQLITEYRSVMTRENELNELMAKARTGRTAIRRGKPGGAYR